MHYSLAPAQRSPWQLVSISVGASDRDGKTKVADAPRWRSLVSRLKALRRRGRRALRIVDVNCGDGLFLIQAAKQARALGFLSIEGVGIDPRAEYIDEARRHSLLSTDLAIGLEFHVGEAAAQLEVEAAFPADIILYEAERPVPQAMQAALKRAGDFTLRASPRSLEART